MAMPEKEETMKSLYVVVVEVNREHTSGIEERMELKAYLNHLVQTTLGYRGKIINSELVKGEDVCQSMLNGSATRESIHVE